MHGLKSALAAGVAVVLAAGPRPAFADACGTVMDAMFAQAKLPYAGSGEMVQSGQAPMHTAVVVTGGKMYVQVMGKWQSLPFSAEETISNAKQKMAATKHICQQAGSEAVNGEAATVYTEHADKADAPESRMWISDRSGLPLKVEIKLRGGAMTQTLEYHYDNIEAPDGVK
jgi:outer membrane lipoprotein-sorting protein